MFFTLTFFFNKNIHYGVFTAPVLISSLGYKLHSPGLPSSCFPNICRTMLCRVQLHVTRHSFFGSLKNNFCIKVEAHNFLKCIFNLVS